ncbi:hypothetical protein BC629DRAFT_1444007 [Irpex lacteus]|nr:hypothetical protein BC629DRAFT_1444007 [Irpex lacteus]
MVSVNAFAAFAGSANVHTLSNSNLPTTPSIHAQDHAALPYYQSDVCRQLQRNRGDPCEDVRIQGKVAVLNGVEVYTTAIAAETEDVTTARSSNPTVSSSSSHSTLTPFLSWRLTLRKTLEVPKCTIRLELLVPVASLVIQATGTGGIPAKRRN